MGEARKKIIMVDDVNFNLLIGKSRLSRHYEVYPAQSADRMFEILVKVDPDLILLDIDMPGVDGYEAIRKLKADGRYSDIPVVFLTGKTDEQSTAKGMRLGAADYVTKPFSIPGLIERIEKLLDPNGGAPAGDRSGAEKPPVAVATAGKPAEPGPEDAEPDPEEEPPPEEDAEKPCVLAIDDSPAMLRLISYALSDTYRVCTLPQPEKLRRFLRTTTPDLFLLDYKMPVMSGMDLIPVIRDFPNHKETPVIFLTSERSAALVEEAAALGVCDVVIKPFEPKALREAMEKHLRKG